MRDLFFLKKNVLISDLLFCNLKGVPHRLYISDEKVSCRGQNSNVSIFLYPCQLIVVNG